VHNIRHDTPRTVYALNGYLRFVYYNSKRIIRLRPYSKPRTGVPLSRSIVFIASDGMLMALYKVVSFSPNTKKTVKNKNKINEWKNSRWLSKNIQKSNVIIVYQNVDHKDHFWNVYGKINSASPRTWWALRLNAHQIYSWTMCKIKHLLSTIVVRTIFENIAGDWFFFFFSIRVHCNNFMQLVSVL
jgi:hypothetical protein